MAESFIVNPQQDKKTQYEEAYSQFLALIEGENNWIANVGNIMAGLKFGFNFFWLGIYIVDNEELILGPFQGPIACTRIKKGKGVCGTSWKENKTILVPNVEEFEGHIACSSDTKSEIVIPLRNSENKIIGVLDVDSEILNRFDEQDQKGLEKIALLISQLMSR